MKKMLKAVCCLLVLLVFAISGCATQQSKSRTAQLEVGKKTYEAWITAEKTMLVGTKATFWVNGKQMGEMKEFGPFTSAQTFRGELDKKTFEAMCSMDPSGHGIVQNGNCLLYVGGIQKDQLTF